MDLEQRLARLERANRRMKRIGALVLLMAAVVLLSGQAKGKAPLPDLEVGSLTLKDKDGKSRVVLFAPAHGSPGLSLYDKDGQVRVRLTVHWDGLPALYLYDKDGKTRMRLVVEGGLPRLTLFDAKGDVLWQAPR